VLVGCTIKPTQPFFLKVFANLLEASGASAPKRFKEVGKMNVPVKKFQAGGVQVAVWENDGKEGKKFKSVSFQKSYKDSNDEWKHTSSLNANDLPKAIVALQKAFEWIVLKEPETGQEKQAIEAFV